MSVLQFIHDYPAATALVVSLLWVGITGLSAFFASFVYSHVMKCMRDIKSMMEQSLGRIEKTFTSIDKALRRNDEEHVLIRERLAALEVLVRNGGKD